MSRKLLREDIMQSKKFDVAVIGAGIYGQLTAIKLAQAGLNVIILDAYIANNVCAASVGVTRVAHTLYDESVYFNLAKESLLGFQQFLEKSIYNHDAVLFAENSDAQTHAQKVIQAGFNNHTYLSEAQLDQKFPYFKADYACLDSLGGVFQLEPIRHKLKQSLLDLSNVDLRYNCEISNIDALKNSFCLFTNLGQINAEKLIIAAGYGSQEVVNKINLPYKLDLGISMVAPGSLHHFKPRNSEQKIQALSMPAFAYIERGVFGIPMVEGVMDSVKIAGFFDPKAEQKRGEEALGFLKTHIPFLLEFEEIEPPVKDGCKYDYTKDGHFILGNLNTHTGLYLACGWNGGGYKFAYGVSDLLCQSILTGNGKLPDLFTPNRLIG